MCSEIENSTTPQWTFWLDCFHKASVLRMDLKPINSGVCNLWPAGSVPSWLQGTLLRNGPGLFSVGNSEYNHWFDGLSLIHSFTFSNGQTLINLQHHLTVDCQLSMVLLNMFNVLMLLFQVRWLTEVSFWRATPIRETSRQTRLLSLSLGPWSTPILAKTSSLGKAHPDHDLTEYMILRFPIFLVSVQNRLKKLKFSPFSFYIY